ncbi:MAG: nitrate reductase, partial [Candidatus Omnitrophica bacterium]|nr:nitrate reductase [Candidatus Omnitrophota bacterium]
KGQPCDFSGIQDYEMIEQAGGIQWPFPSGKNLEGLFAGALMQQRRLFEDGHFFHPDGKACFRFEEPRSSPEPVSEEHPFIFLTGRGTSAQWHTQTRTGKSAILRKMYPADPYVEINPYDAEQLKVDPSQWVQVMTRRGRIRAQVMIVPTVRRGQIFMPMHYVTTNQLTFPAFDPYSRQPSYKICAARILTEGY